MMVGRPPWHCPYCGWIHIARFAAPWVRSISNDHWEWLMRDTERCLRGVQGLDDWSVKEWAKRERNTRRGLPRLPSTD